MEPRSFPPASGRAVDLIGNLPDPALAGTLERLIATLPGVGSASVLRISGMQVEFRVFVAEDGPRSLDLLRSAIEDVAFSGLGLVVEGSSAAGGNPVIVFSVMPLREAARRRARRPRAVAPGDATRDEQAFRPRGTPRAAPGIPGAWPPGAPVASPTRTAAPAVDPPAPLSGTTAPVAQDPASRIRSGMLAAGVAETTRRVPGAPGSSRGRYPGRGVLELVWGPLGGLGRRAWEAASAHPALGRAARPAARLHSWTAPSVADGCEVLAGIAIDVVRSEFAPWVRQGRPVLRVAGSALADGGVVYLSLVRAGAVTASNRGRKELPAWGRGLGIISVTVARVLLGLMLNAMTLVNRVLAPIFDTGARNRGASSRR